MSDANQHSRAQRIAREFAEIPFPDHEARILAEAYLASYDRGWADGRKEGLEIGENERLQLRASFYEVQQARDDALASLAAIEEELEQARRERDQIENELAEEMRQKQALAVSLIAVEAEASRLRGALKECSECSECEHHAEFARRALEGGEA